MLLLLKSVHHLRLMNNYQIRMLLSRRGYGKLINVYVRFIHCKKKVRVFVCRKLIIFFDLEKPTEVAKIPALAKPSTGVFRKTNGQFAPRPSIGVTLTNIVS